VDLPTVVLEFDPPIFSDGFETGDTSAWSSNVGGAKLIATVPSPGDELFVELEVNLHRPGRTVVIGLSASGDEVLRLELEGRPGELWVAIAAKLDDDTWVATAPQLLAAGYPTLALEWRRSWGESAHNGEMALTFDGATVAWLTNLDTDGQSIREIVKRCH
jgi:hypothetical protein